MTPVDMAKNLDLVSIVKGAGVELQQRGGRHIGLCPFHDEKTPSFFTFKENRFKCFGCNFSGDVIDFVQKMHGLSFREALKHLGVEQNSITPKVRQEIAKRKRKSELVKKFKDWELHYCIYVSDLHFRTKKLMMSGIPPEDLDLYALLLHELPIWENHIHILIHGSDREKFELYKEAKPKCRNSF